MRFSKASRGTQRPSPSPLHLPRGISQVEGKGRHGLFGQHRLPMRNIKQVSPTCGVVHCFTWFVTHRDFMRFPDRVKMDFPSWQIQGISGTHRVRKLSSCNSSHRNTPSERRPFQLVEHLTSLTMTKSIPPKSRIQSHSSPRIGGPCLQLLLFFLRPVRLSRGLITLDLARWRRDDDERGATHDADATCCGPCGYTCPC